MSLLPADLALFAESVPTPVVPLPAQWTFWCDRTVSKAPLGPVQPTAFSYSASLSGFGTGTVTLPVDSIPLTHDDLLALWSWRLWAYYDGQPVWCGCPTGISDTGGAAVEVTLTELAGYLTRRQFDIAAGKTYTQIEQTTIAQDLAGPVTDVGVAILAVPGPGVLRDRSYEYLEGQSRAELLTNLAGVSGGPEFRCEYGVDPDTGNPTATLRIAYPRVGADTGLGIAVPGNAIDYSAQWDADQYRTRTYAVGDLPDNAAQGATQPVILVDRPQTGVPRLDAVDKWDGTVLVSTLRERANTAATIYASPALAVAGSVFESSPPFGSYGLGDTVTISLRDQLLPDGLITAGRLTGMNVDAATGQIGWTVSTTQPPARPRKTLSQQLGGLDSLTSQMFKGNLLEQT